MPGIAATNIHKGRKVGYMNSYILQRIKRNKNFICCITGQTGSGKSYTALREGEELDPNFDIRNVCFTPLEFIQLINGKTKELKRGAVIIYDEVQVTMAATDFQNMQAKLVNACLQTFRFRGFILFMTSPYFKFVNKSARRLFHGRWETIAIDNETKQCIIKPFLLQTSQESDQTYRKYLRVCGKGMGVMPYKRMFIGLASEKIRADYEAKRSKFSNDLNTEIENKLLKQEQDKLPKPPKELDRTRGEKLTLKQEQWLELWQEGRRVGEIADILGYTNVTSSNIKKRLEQKGFKLDREENKPKLPFKQPKKVENALEKPKISNPSIFDIQDLVNSQNSTSDTSRDKPTSNTSI